jgi:hypothetical protein
MSFPAVLPRIVALAAVLAACLALARLNPGGPAHCGWLSHAALAGPGRCRAAHRGVI